MTAYADQSHNGENLPLKFDDIIGDYDFINNPANLPLLQKMFLERQKSKEQYNVIQNKVTSEYFVSKTPLRGNDAYARKKLKSLLPVFDAVGDSKLCRRIKGSRTGTMVNAYAMLITLTFDHNIWTPSDAWLSLKGSNSLINSFKAELSRIFGSSYGCFCSKEGTESSYPAPHLVVVFDKPFIAHKVGKKWYLGKNYQRTLLDKIQSVWNRLAGSFSHANAIVDKHGFTYAFKYVTKKMNFDSFLFNDTKKSDFVCINTHMFHTLFDLNDIVSPAFLSKLGYIKQLNILDKLRSKLKQTNSEILDMQATIESLGGFNSLAYSVYRDLFDFYFTLIAESERLTKRIQEEKMNTSPWFFLRGGFKSDASAQRFIDSLTASE